MQVIRTARWLLLALLLSVFATSAHAGVLISVGFAPPPMPVYEQPPCPEDGLMWTPGYWAYGDNGYYWVPGTWVPAPQPGFLWTPHYWGWEGGHYIFHEGYWGPHVGYYGGVNYGFGYGGIGFAGGEWRGGHFAYNTAVIHVGFHGGVVFNDPGRVHVGIIENPGHVGFSGGPGGIHHDPSPTERVASQDHHLAPTGVQTQHQGGAASNPGAWAKNNGGHPANAVASRPLQGGPSMHTSSTTTTHSSTSTTTTTSHTGNMNGSHSTMAPAHNTSVGAASSHSTPEMNNRPSTQPHNSFGGSTSGSHPAPQVSHPAPQPSHSAPAPTPHPQMMQQHSAPAPHPQAQHSAPAQHQAPASHPAQEPHGKR
ncbi:MAG: hypothetical protein ABSF70_20240 [Terracidiphilus sp.]